MRNRQPLPEATAAFILRAWVLVGTGECEVQCSPRMLALEKNPPACVHRQVEKDQVFITREATTRTNVSQDRLGPTMRVRSPELVFDIKPLTGLCRGRGKSSPSKGHAALPTSPGTRPRPLRFYTSLCVGKAGLPSAH